MWVLQVTPDMGPLRHCPVPACTVKSRTFQNSVHSDTGPMRTSTRKGGRRVSTGMHPGRLKLSISDLSPTLAHGHSISLRGQHCGWLNSCRQLKEKVHYDVVSNVMVMQVKAWEDTFVWVTQEQFNIDCIDMLKLLAIAAKEHQMHFANAGHSTP